MSGNPLLGITRDGDKGLKVIQTERGPIAPGAGLIHPFSLPFCQIVALMLPHRSRFAGLLCFLFLGMKLALSQEEESQCTVHGGNASPDYS